jgi:hypothetical protein
MYIEIILILKLYVSKDSLDFELYFKDIFSSHYPQQKMLLWRKTLVLKWFRYEEV